MIRARAIVLLLFLGAAAAYAQSPASTPAPKRPTTVIEQTNCVTSECHSTVKGARVVHGPVANNSCNSCHDQTSVEKHTFTVTRKNAELCTFCHEFSVTGMPTIHKPVAEGECLGCHDPHGGKTKAITREETTGQLCGRCHDAMKGERKFLHSPVAQGECDSCHTPHASNFPKLVDVVGADMCLACHKDFEPAIAAAKMRHKALEKGCAQCHDVHGSNTPMALKKAVPDLCLDCHDNIKQKIATATVPHSAISRGESCLNCHAVHAANINKLLNEPEAKGCLKCHDKTIKTQRGYSIPAVNEVVNPKLITHGEIKEGQCHGCHATHGGERAMLLTQPYSRAFYQNFAPEQYALCFTCHDVELVQAELTTKLTGFRNGDVNLHYVHAKTGTRDKNCRACHAIHASENANLVLTTLRYGQWEMPIRYAKTQTGGSCFPGCHRQYAYDREKPVPTTRPTALPALSPTLPRAERAEGQIISWAAKDIRGNAVNVPVADKVTSLVLVAAEDRTSADLLKKLHAATASIKDTQTIVVSIGPNAEQQAVELAGATPWPVVADTNRQAAEALGVHGWPMVLVLRSDGLEVARISGDAAMLAIKVPAYLDRAAGRIDDKTLQQQLAAYPVVQEDPTKRAQRDLRIARVLLDEGRAQQAIAFLDRDAQALASTPEAKALRAEALIQLKKADDALGVIDQISPPEALRPGQVDLLRAQAYMVQERWDLAKPLLESALNKSPDVALTHRLLGRIYELEQNWAKAAEHYRTASDLSARAR